MRQHIIYGFTCGGDINRNAGVVQSQKVTITSREEVARKLGMSLMEKLVMKNQVYLHYT
jgi:hypothetical protein